MMRSGCDQQHRFYWACDAVSNRSLKTSDSGAIWRKRKCLHRVQSAGTASAASVAARSSGSRPHTGVDDFWFLAAGRVVLKLRLGTSNPMRRRSDVRDLVATPFDDRDQVVVRLGETLDARHRQRIGYGRQIDSHFFELGE